MELIPLAIIYTERSDAVKFWEATDGKVQAVCRWGFFGIA
jgi:hypothetical protein